MIDMYSTIAAELDTARNREAGKPIANNTRIFDRGEGVMAIRLHDTDIVTLHPDGRVTLDSGGWQTVTTKERMNRYLPTGASLWQQNKRWYLTLSRNRTPSPNLPDGWASMSEAEREAAYAEYDAAWKAWQEDDRNLRAASTVPYFDGITLDGEGNVLNGPSPAEWREFETRLKAYEKGLTRYVGKVRRELSKGIPMPSGADCWGCCMRDGEGNEVMGHDHLLSHIEEGYVVPSLLVAALREAGYSDTGVFLHLAMNPDEDRMGGPAKVNMGGKLVETGCRASLDVVSRAVRKYMDKRVRPTMSVGR